MSWVKLSESKLQTGQQVLLYLPNGTFYSDRWESNCHTRATHWLPVPEPPKPDPFEEWFMSQKRYNSVTLEL